jgi:hypothetical protein
MNASILFFARKCLVLSSMAVLLCAGLTAFGQATGDNDKDAPPDLKSPYFGALAVHRSGGHVKLGAAANQSSQAAADERALGYCGGAQCEIVVRFQGRCAAYAEGPISITRPSGVAVRKTKKGAEDAALRRCAKESDGACKVLLVRCNKGP